MNTNLELDIDDLLDDLELKAVIISDFTNEFIAQIENIIKKEGKKKIIEVIDK